MAGFSGFEPDALSFLDQLATRDPDWFKTNKKTYQALVAEPAKTFVDALGGALRERISSGIVAQAKTNGSIAPINNDLRFSPDKPPYKDHLLFRFWEGADKKSAPTLYVRLAGEGVGFATGALLSDLAYWREAVASPAGAGLASALAKLAKANGAEIVGRELKRVPAPYPADHPREELLRHKMLQLRWQEALPAALGKPGFVDWCARRLERCADVHHWLVAELG